MTDDAIAALDIGGHVSAEDFLPVWLREALPEHVTVVTRLEDGMSLPAVLVKETMGSNGYVRARPETDVIELELHTFTDGIDAEVDGWRLQWAMWSLIDGWASRGRRIDSRGSVLKFATQRERPRRRADWADATGPVQYQDLPLRIERFVQPIRLLVKR